MQLMQAHSLIAQRLPPLNGWIYLAKHHFSKAIGLHRLGGTGNRADSRANIRTSRCPRYGKALSLNEGGNEEWELVRVHISVQPWMWNQCFRMKCPRSSRPTVAFLFSSLTVRMTFSQEKRIRTKLSPASWSRRRRSLRAAQSNDK